MWQALGIAPRGRYALWPAIQGGSARKEFLFWLLITTSCQDGRGVCLLVVFEWALILTPEYSSIWKGEGLNITGLVPKCYECTPPSLLPLPLPTPLPSSLYTFLQPEDGTGCQSTPSMEKGMGEVSACAAWLILVWLITRLRCPSCRKTCWGSIYQRRNWTGNNWRASCKRALCDYFSAIFQGAQNHWNLAISADSEQLGKSLRNSHIVACMEQLN